MDWGAIGAIGTSVAAIIAFAQWRVVARPKPVPRKTPQIRYKILEGRGKVAKPKEWSDANLRTTLPDFWKISRIFDEIRFAHLLLRNDNKFSISNIKLEISAGEDITYQVEYTNKLAKSAVYFHRPDVDTLLVLIDELPAGEQIVISILGSRIGGLIKSANASVEVDTNWTAFDW